VLRCLPGIVADRRVCNNPGSAVHRFALHRVREMLMILALI